MDEQRWYALCRYDGHALVGGPFDDRRTACHEAARILHDSPGSWGVSVTTDAEGSLGSDFAGLVVDIGSSPDTSPRLVRLTTPRAGSRRDGEPTR